jgi:hypothetical protein
VLTTCSLAGLQCFSLLTMLLAAAAAAAVCVSQRSIALPDVHSGYGFAIGNVAAFDMNNPEVRPHDCSAVLASPFLHTKQLLTERANRPCVAAVCCLCCLCTAQLRAQHQQSTTHNTVWRNLLWNLGVALASERNRSCPLHMYCPNPSVERSRSLKAS